MHTVLFFVRLDSDPVEKRVFDTDDVGEAVRQAKLLIENTNLAGSSALVPEGFVVLNLHGEEVFNSFNEGARDA